MKEWTLIAIVGRLSRCSSSRGNDVKFMPQAVKRFRPDRKFPPLSRRLKCDILFREAEHPVRSLRVATVTTKVQKLNYNGGVDQMKIFIFCQQCIVNKDQRDLDMNNIRSILSLY